VEERPVDESGVSHAQAAIDGGVEEGPVSVGDGSSRFELNGNVDTTEDFGSNGDDVKGDGVKGDCAMGGGVKRDCVKGDGVKGDPEKIMETIWSKILLG